MEMEAETPEPGPIMKMDVKEIPASQLGTVSDKAPLGKLEQVEDEFLRPGTSESSTSTDKSESIQSCRNGTVYINTEGKMRNFKSDSSLESPSLAIKVSEDISEVSKDNEERVNPVLTETEDAENVREFWKEQTDETVEPTGGNMTTGDKEAFTEMSLDNARAEDFGPLNSSEWTKEQNHFVNNGETYSSRPITTFSNNLNQQEGQTQENEPVVDDIEQKNKTCIADKQGPDEENLHSSGIIHHQDFGEITDDRRDEVLERRSIQDEAATSAEIDKTEDKKSGEDPDFKLVEQDKVKNIEAESYIIPVLETPNKSLKEEANQPVLHKEELECKEESSNSMSMAESVSPARDILPDKTSQGAAESEKTIIPIVVVTDEKEIQESRVEENRLPDNTAPSLDETSIGPVELQRESEAEDATESETQDNDTIDRVDSVLEKSQIKKEKTEQNDIEVAYEVEKNEVNPNSDKGNMEGTLTKQENKGPKLVRESEDTQKAIRKEDGTCNVQDLTPMPTREPQKDESSKENDEGRMPKEEVNEEPITSGDEKNAKQNKEADSTIETLTLEESSHDENQVKRIENAGAENIGESSIEEDIVPDLSTTTGTEAVQDNHEKYKVFEGIKNVSVDEEEDVVDQSKATNEEDTIKHGHEEEDIAELEVAQADFDTEETSVEEIVLKNSATIVKNNPHEDGHDQNEITGRSQTVSVGEGIGEVENDVPGPSETTMKDGHQEEKGIEVLETTSVYKDISETFAYEVADLDQSLTTIEGEPHENDHEIRKVTRGSHITDAEGIGESKGENDFIPNHSETSAKEQGSRDDRKEEEVNEEAREAGADKETKELIGEEIVGPDHSTTIIGVEQNEDDHEENIEKDIVQDHSRETTEEEKIKEGYEEEKVNVELEIANAEEIINSPIKEEVIVLSHYAKITKDEQNIVGHEENKVTKGAQLAGVENDIGEIITEVISSKSETAITKIPIKDDQEEQKVTEEIELVGSDRDSKEHIIAEFVENQSTTIITNEPIQDGHEVNKITGESHIACITEVDVVPSHSEITIGEVKINDGHKEEKVLERTEIADAAEDARESTSVIPDHSTTANDNESTTDGHENKVARGSHIADVEDKGVSNVEKDSIHSETIAEEQPHKYDYEEQKTSKELLDGEDKSNIEPIMEELVVLKPHTTEIKDETIVDGQQERKVRQGFQNDVGKDIGETIKEEDVAEHSEGTTGKEPKNEGYQDGKVNEEIREAAADKETTELIREEIVGADHPTTIIEDEATEEIIEKDIVQDQSKETTEDERIKDAYEEEKVNEELEVTNAEIINNQIQEEVIVLSQSTKNTKDEPSEVGQEEKKITEEAQMAGADNDIGETITEEDVISSQFETDITEKPIKHGHEEEKVVEKLEQVGSNRDSREQIIAEFVQSQSTVIITDKPVQDGQDVNKVMETSQIACIAEEEVVPSYSETTIMEVKINDDQKDEESERPEIAGADPDNRESTSDISDHSRTTNDNDSTTNGHEDKVSEGSKYGGPDKDIDESVEKNIVPSNYDRTTGENPIKYVHEEDKVTEGLKMAGADMDNKESNTKEDATPDPSTTTAGKDTPENVAETIGVDNDIGDPIIEDDVVIRHSVTTVGEELNSDGLNEAKKIEADGFLNNSKATTGEEQSRDGKEENKVLEELEVATKGRDIGEPAIEDVGVPNSPITSTEDEPIRDEYQEDKVHESLKADAEVEATTKEILEDDNVIDLLETSIEEEIQKNICHKYETTVDACATQLSTDSNRVEISMEDPQEDKMETKKHTETGQHNGCLEPNSDTPDSTEMIETQILDEGEEHKNCNADAVVETIVGEKAQKESSDVLRDTSSGINFKTADMADMVETVNFNGEDLHKSRTADTTNEDTETIQNKSSEILQEASSFPGASEEQRKEGIIEDNIDTNDRANNASLEKDRKMISSNETEENNNNLPDGIATDASIIYIETTASKKEQGPIETFKEYPVEEIKRTEVTDHLRDHEIQTKQVVAYSDLASVEQNFEPVVLSQERVVESENKHDDGLTTTNRSLEKPAKEVAKVIQEEKVSDEDEDIPKEAEHNGESCEMNTEPDIVIPPSLEENSIDRSSTLSPKSELESMKLERTDGSDSTEVADHNGVMDNNGDAKTMKEQSSSAIFETDAVKGEDTHERNMAEDGAVNDQTSDPRNSQSLFGDEQENIKSNTEEKHEDLFHMNAVNYSTITKTQNEEVIQSLEVAGASMEVEKYTIQEKEVELDHSTMYVREETVEQIFQEKEQEKTEKEAPGEIVAAENDTKQFVEDSASTRTSSAMVDDVSISTHGEQLNEIKEATIDKEAVETPTINEMPAEESCMASSEEQAIEERSQEAEMHDDLKKADVEKDAGNQTMEYEAGTDISMKLVEAQAADLSSHENENEKEQHGREEATDSSNETEVAPLEEEYPKKSLNDFSATETSLAEIPEMESPDNLDYTSTRLDISESIDGTTENTRMVTTPNEENRASSQDSNVEDVKHKTVSIGDNATENIFIVDNSFVADAEQEKCEIADEDEQEKSEIPEGTSLLVMQSVHKDIETTPKVETSACKTSSDDMSENKPQEVAVMASDKQELDAIEMKQKVKDESPVQDEFIDKRETLLVAKTERDVQDEEHVKLEGNETETKTTEQKISVPSNSENDDPEKEKDVRNQTMEYAARPDVNMKLVEEKTSEVRSHENESEKEKKRNSGEVKHSDLVCTKEATDYSDKIKEAPLEEEYPKKSLTDFRATETSLEEITEMESCDNLNNTSTRSHISKSIDGITENTSRNHEPTYVTLLEDNLSSQEAEEDGGGLVDATNLASVGMVSTSNEENRASSQDSNVEDVKHQTISIEDNETKNTFIADNSEAAEAEQEKSEIADEAEQGKSEIPPETSVHVIEPVHKNIETTPKVETAACEKFSDDILEHKPEVSVMASEKQEFDAIERREKIKDEFPIEDEIVDKRETFLVTQTEGDVQNEEHVKLEENEIETESTEPKIAIPSNAENNNLEKEKDPLKTLNPSLEESNNEIKVEEKLAELEATDQNTKISGSYDLIESVALAQNLEAVDQCDEPKSVVLAENTVDKEAPGEIVSAENDTKQFMEDGASTRTSSAMVEDVSISTHGEQLNEIKEATIEKEAVETPTKKEMPAKESCTASLEEQAIEERSQEAEVHDDLKKADVEKDARNLTIEYEAGTDVSMKLVEAQAADLSSHENENEKEQHGWEEATDSSNETDVAPLEEEDPKKGLNDFSATETSLAEITEMESPDYLDYNSTRLDISESIDGTTENTSKNQEPACVTLAYNLSSHEAEKDGGGLVDATNLASAGMVSTPNEENRASSQDSNVGDVKRKTISIEDNATENIFIADNSGVAEAEQEKSELADKAEQEKSEIPEGTSLLVMQSVHKDIETTPKVETTACKTSSEDMSENKPQEVAVMASDKQELAAIEMKQKVKHEFPVHDEFVDKRETLLVAKTEGDVPHEEHAKLEGNEMETKTTEQNISVPSNSENNDPDKEKDVRKQTMEYAARPDVLLKLVEEQTSEVRSQENESEKEKEQHSGEVKHSDLVCTKEATDSSNKIKEAPLEEEYPKNSLTDFRAREKSLEEITEMESCDNLNDTATRSHISESIDWITENTSRNHEPTYVTFLEDNLSSHEAEEDGGGLVDATNLASVGMVSTSNEENRASSQDSNVEDVKHQTISIEDNETKNTFIADNSEAAEAEQEKSEIADEAEQGKSEIPPETSVHVIEPVHKNIETSPKVETTACKKSSDDMLEHKPKVSVMASEKQEFDTIERKETVKDKFPIEDEIIDKRETSLVTQTKGDVQNEEQVKVEENEIETESTEPKIAVPSNAENDNQEKEKDPIKTLDPSLEKSNNEIKVEEKLAELEATDQSTKINGSYDLIENVALAQNLEAIVQCGEPKGVVLAENIVDKEAPGETVSAEIDTKQSMEDDASTQTSSAMVEDVNISTHGEQLNETKEATIHKEAVEMPTIKEMPAEESCMESLEEQAIEERSEEAEVNDNLKKADVEKDAGNQTMEYEAGTDVSMKLVEARAADLSSQENENEKEQHGGEVKHSDLVFTHEATDSSNETEVAPLGKEDPKKSHNDFSATETSLAEIEMESPDNIDYTSTRLDISESIDGTTENTSKNHEPTCVTLEDNLSSHKAKKDGGGLVDATNLASEGMVSTSKDIQELDAIEMKKTITDEFPVQDEFMDKRETHVQDEEHVKLEGNATEPKTTEQKITVPCNSENDDPEKEKGVRNQTMEYAARPDVTMKLVEEQTSEVRSHENESEREKEQDSREVKHSDLVFTKEATDSSNKIKEAPLEEEYPKKSLTDFRATEASLEEITEMESCDNLNDTSTRSHISESIDWITENTSRNHEPTYVTLLEENLSSREAEEDGGDLVDATNLASVGMASTPNEENRAFSQDSNVEDVKHQTISIEDNATENTFIADNSEAAEAEQEKSEIAEEAEQGKSEIPPETSVHVIEPVHKNIETTPKVETTACEKSSDDMLEHKPEEVSVIATEKQEFDTIERKEKIKDEFPIEDAIIEKRETSLVTETEGDVQIEEHVKLEENEIETESTESKIAVPSNAENDNLEKEKDPLKKLDLSLEEGNNKTKVEEKLAELEATDQSTKISGSYDLIENVALAQNLEAVVQCDEPKGVVLAENTVDKEDVQEIIPIENIQLTESENLEKVVEHIPVSPSSTKETSVDVDEQYKVDSDFEANMHNEGVAKSCDTVNAGYEKVEEIFQKDKKGDIIKEAKCESEPLSPSMTKETSVEGDEQFKVDSDAETNIHNGGIDKICDTVTSGDVRGEKFSQEGKKGDTVKEDKCELEEDQKKQQNVEIEATEHETLADELQVPKKLDNISDTENNESNILGETADPTLSCQTAHSDRSYTDKITEGLKEESNVSDKVAKLVNEEFVSESNTESVRREETYEANAKLENEFSNQEIKFPNQKVLEELGNSGGIHDTVKQLIKEKKLIKDPNLVVVGEESFQNAQGGENFEDAGIEKEPITLEEAKPYLGRGVKDEGLKRNDITTDEIVNGMLGSSHVASAYKDTSQEDITGGTGPVSVEEDKSGKCEALLIGKARSEEVSVEVGKQIEEETDFIPDEQIRETIITKPENTETVSKDTSGPEGFVEVMKPSDSLLDTATLSTTDNLHIKEDLPTDDTNVTSFKEASQLEIEGKEGQSTEVAEKQEELFSTEPTNKILEESGKDIEHEALTAETLPKSVEIIYELELQERLCPNEDRDNQPLKHPDTPDKTAEKLISMEADFVTRTEENISVTSKDVSSFPRGMSGTSLEATEVKSEKHEETLGNDLGRKEAISEDKEMQNQGEEKDTDLKSLEGVSLFNLLSKTEEATSPILGDLEETRQNNKENVERNEAPDIETEKEDKTEEIEKDEEEKYDDEPKKDDSGSDAPVMVEDSKDINIKTTPKKSHSILSGVGSKVKHSISKVKKAITGKSSHQKHSPTK